jgi:hypothetical protein
VNRVDRTMDGKIYCDQFPYRNEKNIIGIYLEGDAY